MAAVFSVAGGRAVVPSEVVVLLEYAEYPAIAVSPVRAFVLVTPVLALPLVAVQVASSTWVPAVSPVPLLVSSPVVFP